MNGILVYAVLALEVVSGEPLAYQQAHDQAVATKRPMLVLVGADWCPACRTMKHSTLPRMQQDGKLKDVIYTVIDVDAQPTLASKFMRSSLIPQLFVYAPASNGWYRIASQGAQSPQQVRAMIDQGLAYQKKDAEVAVQAPTAQTSESSGDE